MKKTVVVLMAFFLAGTFAVNASVTAFNRPHHKPHPERGGHPGVGAPLDGGLLTILGAAGVAYYGARKKKRTPEA